ncbi:hypothetical protein EDB19DRAFT_1948313 [Suillus lakei]|nr:hypothetical protein EDB19DRAFT_1948313 [Suillus lakei]
MDNLQTLVEMFEGKHSDDVLWYTVRKAVVASKQGHCDLARELIQKSSELFQFFALHNAHTFLQQSYGSARIELTTGEYERAMTHFTTTIEGCDMQGNLTFKALSIRGLGEVAFAHGNFALAAERFAETRSLCTEMGVPPGKLYCCPIFCSPEPVWWVGTVLGGTVTVSEHNVDHIQSYPDIISLTIVQVVS